MRTSTNALGISSIIVAALYLFGVEVDVTQIDQLIASILFIYGTVKVIINQLKRPDVKRFFFKVEGE